MRLNEIFENYENLKRRWCFTHSTRQNKHEEVIKRCMCRLDADHVSGSVYEDEDFEDVDEVRRGLIVTIEG